MKTTERAVAFGGKYQFRSTGQSNDIDFCWQCIDELLSDLVTVITFFQVTRSQTGAGVPNWSSATHHGFKHATLGVSDLVRTEVLVVVPREARLQDTGLAFC
jgi:hypothetical protein